MHKTELSIYLRRIILIEFKVLIAFFMFSLLGLVRIPETDLKNGVTKKKFLFKSPNFPQIILYSFIIMFIINTIFFKKPFSYIGLLLTFLFLLSVEEIIIFSFNLLIKIKH